MRQSKFFWYQPRYYPRKDTKSSAMVWISLLLAVGDALRAQAKVAIGAALAIFFIFGVHNRMVQFAAMAWLQSGAS